MLRALTVTALCLFALFSPSVASAADDIPTIRDRIAAVDDLESRGVLTAEQAEQQRAFYVERASEIAGEPMTLEKIEGWSSLQRFFTFVNVVYVLAGILLVIALGWLFAIYILPILAEMPPEVWEVLLYASSIGLMFGVKGFLGIDTIWIVFPGCLALIGALMLTLHLHFPKAGDSRGAITFVSLVCFAAWSVAAFYHGSSLIGFLAVLALESFLGFSIFVGPLCIGLGFEKEDMMPRATFASLALLVLGCVVQVFGGMPEGALKADAVNLVSHLGVLNPGLIFVGTFVYFIGLLILGSRWYILDYDYRSGRRKGWGLFWLLQGVTVLSGFAALYFGSVLGIGMLQGIGGTFFGIYLLEKYVEISFKRVGFAWMLLGFAVILYYIATYAQANPDYFLLGFNR